MIFRIGWSFWVHFPQYFKDFFRISEDSRKFFGFCGFLGIFRIVGGFWVHFSRYFQGFFQFSSSSYSGFTLNFRISEDFQDFSGFSGSIRNFTEIFRIVGSIFHNIFRIFSIYCKFLSRIYLKFQNFSGFLGDFQDRSGVFWVHFRQYFQGFSKDFFTILHLLV